MSTFNLDTAPAGSIITIGNPADAVTARKRGDGVWAYTHDTTTVTDDDIRHAATPVFIPPTPAVDPKREVSEEEFKALATIESVERLIRRVRTTLDHPERPEAIPFAQNVLDEAERLCSERTCTAVKSMPLSDRISAAAREQVDRAVTKVRKDLEEVRRND